VPLNLGRREPRANILHIAWLGTIRKVQEAAIRINRRKIQALYREKKKLSQQSRPTLFQTDGEDTKGDAEWNKEAEAAIEKERQTIKAIQQ
jgi:hypothetical protein